jgi:hypothetical protein
LGRRLERRQGLPALLDQREVAAPTVWCVGPAASMMAPFVWGGIMANRLREQWLPISIGFLALVVASTGTAVAATGTVVNIADGANAARVAHVDSSGRLMTNIGSNGIVFARPAPATTPFFEGVAAQPSPNANAVTPTAVSNLAISTIVAVPTAGLAAPAILFLFWKPTALGSACPTTTSVSSSFLFFYVNPKDNVTMTFPTPLTKTGPACLYAQAFNSGANNISVYVDGYTF